MHQPVRESDFLETACGAVYFLGRWPNAETWCIVRRNHEGGQSIQSLSDQDAKALWLECVGGSRCVECEAPMAFDRCYTDREQREALGLCFECNFWRERIATGQNIAVIDGYRYSIAPDAPKGFRGFTGHGGSKFVIRFHNGREVVTHNLWANGRIPQNFIERIPNNAVFVKAAQFGGYVGVGSAIGAPDERGR